MTGSSWRWILQNSITKIELAHNDAFLSVNVANTAEIEEERFFLGVALGLHLSEGMLWLKKTHILHY